MSQSLSYRPPDTNMRYHRPKSKYLIKLDTHLHVYPHYLDFVQKSPNKFLILMSVGEASGSSKGGVTQGDWQ